MRRRQLEAAEAAINRVRATALEACDPAGEPYSAFLFALLRLEQGTFEGLLEVFDRLAAWVPDLPVEAPLPLILAAGGEVERAARTYQQLAARRPWESSDNMATIVALSLLGALATRFEDAETVREIVALLEPHAGEYVVVAGVVGMLAPVTLTLGEMAATLGRYDGAIAYLEGRSRSVAVPDCGAMRSARNSRGPACWRGATPAAIAAVRRHSAAKPSAAPRSSAPRS
jgi:hypothetical protein